MAAVRSEPGSSQLTFLAVCFVCLQLLGCSLHTVLGCKIVLVNLWLLVTLNVQCEITETVLKSHALLLRSSLPDVSDLLFPGMEC